MGHKREWAAAEWQAAMQPWARFHACYPHLAKTQRRSTRRPQRAETRLHPRSVRGPQTPSEQRVAQKLATLAWRATQTPRRANGDRILAALREWWQDTRGTS